MNQGEQKLGGATESLSTSPVARMDIPLSAEVERLCRGLEMVEDDYLKRMPSSSVMQLMVAGAMVLEHLRESLEEEEKKSGLASGSESLLPDESGRG